MLDLVRIRLPRAFKGPVAAAVLGLGMSFALGARAQEAEPAPEGKTESAAPQAEAEPAPEAQQQAPASEPAATPPADERPFPPPPPQGGAGGYAANQGYGNQGTPVGYPPPPPDGVYRPFSFTLGAGPGIVRLNNGSDTSPALGISYSLRFGFGVQPDLILTLGFEGTSATFEGTSFPRYDVSKSQDALLLGLQYFVSQVTYVRGAMGIANATEEDVNVVIWDHNGLALQGAMGVDLVQGPNVALSLEAAVMLGRYPSETWTSGGLNLLFSLY